MRISRHLPEMRPCSAVPHTLYPTAASRSHILQQYLSQLRVVGWSAHSIEALPSCCPPPQDFIDLLRPEVCPILECVYLNGCHTLHPLGSAIQVPRHAHAMHMPCTCHAHAMHMPCTCTLHPLGSAIQVPRMHPLHGHGRRGV